MGAGFNEAIDFELFDDWFTKNIYHCVSSQVLGECRECRRSLRYCLTEAVEAVKADPPTLQFS